MAELPTEQQFGDYESWPGRQVLHSGGERLGEVREIYLDRDTSRPEWVLVTIESGSHRFVPLADATIEAEVIRVAHDFDTVSAAPDIGADLRIDPDEERRLYDHYGVPHSQEQSRTVLPDTEAPAGEPEAAEPGAAAGEPAATAAETAEPAETQPAAETAEPATTQREPATAEAGAAEPGLGATMPVEPSPAVFPTPTSAAPQAAAGATDADIPEAARDTPPPSTQDTWTAPPPLPPPAAEPHRSPPVVPIAAGVAAALGAAVALVVWRRRR